jgi:hypothetical protein
VAFTKNALINNISFGLSLRQKGGNFQKLTEKTMDLSTIIGTKLLSTLAVIYIS